MHSKTINHKALIKGPKSLKLFIDYINFTIIIITYIHLNVSKSCILFGSFIFSKYYVKITYPIDNMHNDILITS